MNKNAHFMSRYSAGDTLFVYIKLVEYSAEVREEGFKAQ